MKKLLSTILALFIGVVVYGNAIRTPTPTYAFEQVRIKPVDPEALKKFREDIEAMEREAERRRITSMDCKPEIGIDELDILPLTSAKAG